MARVIEDALALPGVRDRQRCCGAAGFRGYTVASLWPRPQASDRLEPFQAGFAAQTLHQPPAATLLPTKILQPPIFAPAAP
jgi:hypothetical protein